MKLKAYKDKNGRELLKVSLSRKDSFDYATASHLTASSHPYLLPFAFSNSETTPNLYFDLSDCMSLKTFLGGKMSEQQFESIILQLVLALDAINRGNLSEKNMLLEPEYVYVKAAGTQLQLVYLPLLGREANDKAVLDLLRMYAENSHFTTAEAGEKARQFLDFLRQQSVFSVVAMQAYLNQGGTGNLGQMPGATQTASTSVSAQTAIRTQGGQKRARPEVTAKRDFVSTSSGKLSKTQISKQRSVAENIIAAVGENQEAIAHEEVVIEAFAHEEVVIADTGTSILTNWQLPQSPKATASEAAKRYWLVRLQDNRKWELSEGSTTLGRSKACDIQVSDSTMVSRQHAVLTRQGDSFTVCDEGSSNGTSINGQPLLPNHPTSLTQSSTLSLGDISFTIEASSDS